MRLLYVSPSFRVSLMSGLGEETSTADAIRSRMTPEREKEGMSSLSLEASKHRLGSHSIGDISSEKLVP